MIFLPSHFRIKRSLPFNTWSAVGVTLQNKVKCWLEIIGLCATLSNNLSSDTIKNGLNLRLLNPTRTEWFINFHFAFESANQNTPNFYFIILFLQSLSRPILRHKGVWEYRHISIRLTISLEKSYNIVQAGVQTDKLHVEHPWTARNLEGVLVSVI